jgi:TolA-binding protein
MKFDGVTDPLKFAPRAALLESGGKAPEIELLAAQSLTALGRYDDSAQALRDFLKNHPDHQEASTARRYLDRLQQSGKIKP